MATSQRYGPEGLLEYDARYAILICRECQYAIQKSALQSHLLRHKIYRGDRQQLLDSIAHLSLLEPHLVQLPPPTSAPIEALPIISGYRCSATGCDGLCASEKRMRRHWSEVHGERELPTDSSPFFRSAKLQTFFRGTKVRYFEVASSDNHTNNATTAGSANNHFRSEDSQGENVARLLNASVEVASPLNDSLTTSASPSPITLDLEVLNYFHYFIATTSLTLPGVNQLRSSMQYWQSDVVLIALRQKWLMCGLLAITASHLTILEADPMAEMPHREQLIRYAAEFRTGFEEVSNPERVRAVGGAEEDARKAGAQVQCILNCAHWALAGSTLDHETAQESSSTFLPALIGSIRTMALSLEVYRSDAVQHTESEGFQMEAVSQVLGRESSPHDMAARLLSPTTTTDLELLHRLDMLPQRMAEALGKPKNAQDVFSVLSAIAMLRDCCSISFTSDETDVAWRGLVFWAAKVPDHFVQLVSSYNPGALIVLAHWTASLVKRAEQRGCWYMKALPEIICREILDRLPADDLAIRDLIPGLSD